MPSAPDSMPKEDVQLHRATEPDALPMTRLLASEPAVPADSTMMQDAKDEGQDDGLKGSIEEAQAPPSADDEGGPLGVRAVIGGFFIRCVAEVVKRLASSNVGLVAKVADDGALARSFCTWGYAGSWTGGAACNVRVVWWDRPLILRRNGGAGNCIGRRSLPILLRNGRALDTLAESDLLDRLHSDLLRLP